VAATSFTARADDGGLELSSIENHSQVLESVRELPKGVRVYSNLSALTSFMADRSVWPLAIVRDDQDAYVAYYDEKPGLHPHTPAEVEILRNRVRPVRTLSDGILYRLKTRSSLVQGRSVDDTPATARASQSSITR
jgi:hypothetical protein